MQYRVASPVKYEKNGKTETFWQNLGRAFPIKDGGISIKLNGLPISGELVLFEDDGEKEDNSDRRERRK